MKFFRKSPLVIEKEKTIPLPKGPDVEIAIAALADAPGMQYLLAKLALTRDALIAQLRVEKHENLRDVQYLQAGIFWADWLNRQLTHNLKLRANRPRPLTLEEDEYYKSLESTLELIGQTPQG